MNADLNELKARCERLTLLQQVANVIHSTLEPQQALQLIVTQAMQLMRATSGSVVLVNPTTGFMEIHAAIGLPAAAEKLKLRVGEGITGWVARHGKPARIGDVTQDRRYVMIHRKICSELAVPMEVRGEIRGVLNVDSERKNAFTEADQEMLEALAQEAARVIHNTWLYEQSRLKAQLLETLVSVSQTINSTLNLDEALQVVTREACQLMRAKMCSLMMLDESRQWLDLRAHHGAGPAYVKKPRLGIEESLVGIVVRRKKAIQLENVQTSARYQHVGVARQEGLVSLLSVPLLFSGQAIGTLSVYTAQPYHFSDEEIKILSALAELSAIAIEKARLYERTVDVEEQLRQNEKLSAIGLLAAEIAHEIRNPLTVMKMLYHSLDLKFPAGDPRAKDAEVMGQKMDHLNKIVEQILDFARTSEPNLAEVNLNQLIDDLGLLTRHKLVQQKIKLMRTLQADLPLVTADATQLEQAFLNLTLNAVEAMPQGGKLTISTKTERAGALSKHVVITFADTGHGMTEAQSRQAFDSLLHTSKKKGTGLGLAIVRRVVEAHRGKIEIVSKPGRGTAISIILPV
jgi:signal transduction histidine kinase